MLIDTHCHINCMLRGHLTKSAYTEFTPDEITRINSIISQAEERDVKLIINVGTDLIESKSCIELAKLYKNCYAIVGIHPNDTTEHWKSDLQEIKSYVKNAADHK